MELYVEKPINPISDDTVRVPVTYQNPRPEGHVHEDANKICVSNTTNSLSEIVNFENVPLDYHGKRVAVLSQNLRDKLDLDCGDTVSIEEISSDRVSTNARNFDRMEDGEIHIFNAHEYKDNKQNFVSKVLNRHLSGKIIAEGATYTLSKNEHENKQSADKYEFELYVESCDPNPCLYQKPIDMTGRSKYEDRFHPKIVIHDQNARIYEVFDI